MNPIEFRSRFARHIKSAAKKLKSPLQKMEFIPQLHNIVLFFVFHLFYGSLLEGSRNHN